MEEKKNEDYTAVLVSSASNKATMRGNKKISVAVSDADESISSSVKTNKRSRESRIFRSLFVWVAACCFVGLYGLNKIYHQLYPTSPNYISTTCTEEWDIAIDYPDTFPRPRALIQLRWSIEVLARRYGEDIMGKCYHLRRFRNHFSQTPFIQELPAPTSSADQLLAIPQPSADYIIAASAPFRETGAFSSLPPSPSSVAFAPYYYGGPAMPSNIKASGVPSYSMVGPTKSRGYAAAPSSTATFSNGYNYIYLRPLTVNNAQHISVPGESVRALHVFVEPSIEASVHILTASQAGHNSTDQMHIYLKPPYPSYDDHYNNDNDEDDDDIFKHAELQLNGGYGYYDLMLRSTDWQVPITGGTVKCLLQIILPDIPPSSNDTGTLLANDSGRLQRFLFKAKEGHVHATGIAIERFKTTLGRGTVDLTSIDTHDMHVAVLDGKVNLRGIKVKQSLASGVVRGSSTVLAKIHPVNNTYSLINMCADGYTYTDVMTTEEDYDKFAANLHVYRETGTRPLDEMEPMIKLEGDTYYADPSVARLYANSTDVYKTGYMIAPNNDANILVYTGARSDASRAMKSRFLYGYYYENQ